MHETTYFIDAISGVSRHNYVQNKDEVSTLFYYYNIILFIY